MVGSPFGPGNLAFGLRKGSPYTAALNSAILQLRGNGVIDQLKRRWVDDLDQCDDISAQVAFQPLSASMLRVLRAHWQSARFTRAHRQCA